MMMQRSQPPSHQHPSLVTALLLLIALCLLPSPISSPEASSRLLSIDLTEQVVPITTGFTGSDLILFGAVREPGDIVVVVRGPTRTQVVRRKQRTFGVWVNKDEFVFEDVPSFYWVASNRDMSTFMTKELADIHQIGLDDLQLTALGEPDLSLDTAKFRSGLIRNMQRKGLYYREPGSLRFVSDQLFRTRINFPAQVSTGEFAVEVYLIADGKLRQFETTQLSVRKFGIEADVYNLAHQHSLIYGLLAVIIAVVAGWGANAAFRRG